MSTNGSELRAWRRVPLFPLPNVVLFPRAVQPLHVFEARYRTMTAHALDSDGRIAMALLRPGWEKNYYSRPAIEPVVCVGRIISYEQLPDGKFNFLLQGEGRAEIVHEITDPSLPYRTAELKPLPEQPAAEIELAACRRRLLRLFEASPLGDSIAGHQFAGLLRGELPTPLVVDLLAFTYLDDVPLKQALLAEPDVQLRVMRAIDALETSQPVLQAGHLREAADPSLN